MNPEDFTLNEPTAMNIEVGTVGDRDYPFLQIDGLYKYPDRVRQHALEAPEMPAEASHPGIKTHIDLDHSALHRIIWEHLGEQLGYDEQNIVTRSTAAGFRFTRIARRAEELSVHQCVPHCDPVRIAGIVYLNPDGQGDGGTSFYRHRATGVEEAILPRQDEDEAGKAILKRISELGALRSYELYCERMFRMPYREFVRAVLTTLPRTKGYPAAESNEDWELTKSVGMKFNRLIAYPGFLLHSGNFDPDAFGSLPAEQRLTQNIFIR